LKETLTSTEENYIKAIYHLSENGNETVSTNAISDALATTAASVSDMLRKLSEKKIANYEKYRGVTLTKEGSNIARLLVRSHRLWEVFLAEKLGYAWDEVHDIAEKLEHIRNEKLIERLDDFLGNPKYDPHGDPIPDAKGNISNDNYVALSQLKKNSAAVVVGVKDSSAKFLQYLDGYKISLGTSLEVKDIIEYDGSVIVEIDKQKLTLSSKAAECLMVSRA